MVCLHGNVNSQLGECVCHAGWSGALCAESAIPACLRHGERRGQASTPWRVCLDQRTLSCSCVQQCVRGGAFVTHMNKECVKRRKGSGEEAFRWRVGPNRSVTIRATGAMSKPALTRWDGLETCIAENPGSCCRHDGKCAQSPLSACFGNCSGHGECVHGACACADGFYGPGCAHRARDFSPAPAARDAALRIFVYDLPQLATVRRSWASDWDRQRLFATLQEAFMPALLADGGALTDDPRQADLFMAPAYATNMEGLSEYPAHLVETVAAAGPHWARSRGADHLWFCSADHCGNVLRGGGVGRGIVMAHYFTGDASRGVNLAPYLAGAAAAARATYAGFGDAWLAAQEESRRTLLFFAGNVPSGPYELGKGYSQGVRQALWKHHAATPAFTIVERTPDYVQEFQRARFCAAPLGEGWGIRLTWALAYGCIPVRPASAELAISCSRARSLLTRD